MEFTVSRKTWLRGEGSSNSYLLRPSDGKMCCLGFLALSCGLTPAEIEGHSDLFVLERANKLPASLVIPADNPDDEPLNSDVCWDIMAVNDATERKNREERLAELFAQAGIQVTFTD